MDPDDSCRLCPAYSGTLRTGMGTTERGFRRMWPSGLLRRDSDPALLFPDDEQTDVGVPPGPQLI